MKDNTEAPNNDPTIVFEVALLGSGDGAGTSTEVANAALMEIAAMRTAQLWRPDRFVDEEREKEGKISDSSITVDQKINLEEEVWNGDLVSLFGVPMVSRANGASKLLLDNLELLGKMLHHLDKEDVDGYARQNLQSVCYHTNL
ncbi:hypothetical protein Lal_00027907 [Lupinus albus]|nr:hypothetical protein Lal_00027907 [Lupinus albus]